MMYHSFIVSINNFLGSDDEQTDYCFKVNIYNLNTPFQTPYLFNLNPILCIKGRYKKKRNKLDFS